MSDAANTQNRGVDPATPCQSCGHPYGRHWPEWCPDRRCEVKGCECQEVRT